MSFSFTEFVRTLDPDKCEPDPEQLTQLMAALRKALISEMHKRGLWQCPPSYLGILGHGRWRTGSNDEPLQDLLADCYLYIFVRRLRGLKAQLKVKANIDGLIFLNIRHFLHETQKRFDPIGFRVFEVVHLVLRQLVASGDLHIIHGSPRRIRNDTYFTFDPSTPSFGTKPERIAEVVSGWHDTLVHRMVTARGSELQALHDQVGQNVQELKFYDILGFGFKDLVDPLKDDIRNRWAALLTRQQEPMDTETHEQPVANIVAAPEPANSYEDRQFFGALVKAVENALHTGPWGDNEKQYLLRLWQYSRTFAYHAGSGESLPSHRRLAQILEIPRGRLLDLFATLGDLIEMQRKALSRPSPTQSTYSQPESAHSRTDVSGPEFPATATSPLPAEQLLAASRSREVA